MSRPVIQPLQFGATAPETLSLLQKRLQVAEEETEALVRDLGSLGVTREQLMLDLPGRDPPRRTISPVSPLMVHKALSGGAEGVLWRQCESLVGRVCRLESLLHTLKLAAFRLETERELSPSHSARLREQVSALQEQYEEEQRSSQRELMRLKEHLKQISLEREEAQQEVLRLRKELELASTSKMKEQMAEEITARMEAQQSHTALLHRVEEMERTVERERGQVEILQADCNALRIDGQAARELLQDKEELIRGLETECQQLRDQSGFKESLISELTAELKSVRLALQKQQQENSRLIRDGGDLRAAADKVQMLNDQLESQCSELSAALHSLTVENAKLHSEYQNNIKTEQERVSQRLKEQDLLLDAAKRNIQSELQGALSEKLTLQKELKGLQADYAKLQQSSSAAQETAVTQQVLLERTIEKLRGELSSAVRERENTKREGDIVKTEMCRTVSQLEDEKNTLETQLAEARLKVDSVGAALQEREKENRGLMGRVTAMQNKQGTQRHVEKVLQELTDGKSQLAYERGKLQARVQQLEAELTAQGSESNQRRQLNTVLENKYTQTQRENCSLREDLRRLQERHRSTGEVAQTLKNVLASHSRLQHNTETLQTELGGREQELHALRMERFMEMLRQALDMARLDNRKLAQSLEQALLANQSAREKLQQSRDEHQHTVTEREVELRKAKAEIGRLSEHLDCLRNRLRKEKDSWRKKLQQETAELKKSLDDASAKSGDLSRTNRELREKVHELEKLVSNQKSRIKAQKAQLKHHLESRASLASSSQKIKDMETEVKRLEKLKDEYQRKIYEQAQLVQQVQREMASLQSELHSTSSTQREELQAERRLTEALREKCQRLEESVRRLKEERGMSEQRLRDVSLESQQVSENLEEAHSWFRTRFEKLKSEAEQNLREPKESKECSFDSLKEGAPTSPSKHYSKSDGGGSGPSEPEMERWASTLQRWETKKELARIASSHKPMGHSLT
ncbi:coiled-coil domain-containing protein 150 [Chanos chanos]|uniref:Coiled-coil domain-containing protein 150 n=1 Tax=Chanos chanos TaxID=29144 RepID=A0A6J2VP52_CHACN|nr:coiled-coil domain-containing protein 150 [Chanos chanos]